MSFNFPASPSNGQTYTPVGGPVFTWDGIAWKALSQGMPVTVFVGDVAPSAPAFGNLWWESDTGNLYIYYNDGDSAQWVQINGTPAGYQTADTRNRIVNGAMQISQENGTTPVTAGYPVDQFQIQFTIATVLAYQFAMGLVAPAAWALRTQLTTAKPSLAASDLWQLVHHIEGNRVADFRWGGASAKPVVLRFSAYSSQPGTYTVQVRGSDRAYMAAFTITAINTWQEFIIPIPGDTTGTWPTDNSKGVTVSWGLAAGATYAGGAAGWGANPALIQLSGHTNLAAVANSAFILTNVGLYLDPDNTGVAPKWQMPDEAEELRACQRYYWRISTNAGGQGYRYAVATVNSQSDVGTFSFPTTMRVTPAGGIITAPLYTNCSAAAFSIGNSNDAALRALPAAAGPYRAQAGVYDFNARM